MGVGTDQITPPTPPITPKVNLLIDIMFLVFIMKEKAW